MRVAVSVAQLTGLRLRIGSRVSHQPNEIQYLKSSDRDVFVIRICLRPTRGDSIQ